MKQFKVEADEYIPTTLHHLITQHNALCDYIEEREGEKKWELDVVEDADLSAPRTITLQKPPWVKEDHAWNVGYEQGISDASKALGVELRLEDTH